MVKKQSQNSKSKVYYDSGKIEIEGTIQNEKAVGLWTYWYENGQKEKSGQCYDFFINSNIPKPIGMWTYWYENGRKEKEGRFSTESDSLMGGTKEGDWTYWDENGIKTYLNSYEKKGIIVTNYHKNGIISSKGREIYYTPSGYRDGVPLQGDYYKTGKWTYWYENGQKEKKCSYKHRLPESTFPKYHGTYIKWHKNGNKSCEMKYFLGYAVGLEIRWNDDGFVESNVNHGSYFSVTKNKVLGIR